MFTSCRCFELPCLSQQTDDICLGLCRRFAILTDRCAGKSSWKQSGGVASSKDTESMMGRKRAWEEVGEPEEGLEDGSEVVSGKVEVEKVEKKRVVVYLRGTDTVLISYGRAILLRELLEDLCVMQGCLRGVLLKRGTTYGMTPEEVVPIGEYDFVVSDRPGHVDYVRKVHRESIILSNTYLSVNSVVCNDRLTPLRTCEIQLAVDCGAHMELIIPAKKAKQLGLEVIRTERVRGIGGSVLMNVYKGVIVSLLSPHGKVFREAELAPRSKVHEGDQLDFFGGGTKLLDTQPIDKTMSPLPLQVEEISPHKNTAGGLPDGILGLPALEKMRVIIDFAQASMIPIIVEPVTSVSIAEASSEAKS